MGIVKNPGKSGARSVSKRSPSASKKRSAEPQVATVAEPEPEQTCLLQFVREDDIHAQMWKGFKGHHSHRITALLAQIDEAQGCAFAIHSLLHADERGLSAERAAGGGEVYTGLGDFYRSSLFRAQDRLLLEASGRLQDLREMASRGEL